MYRTGTLASIALALAATQLGCGGESPPISCGTDGGLCCVSTPSCSAGLACQAGLCRAGAEACGAQTQACCATGTACVSGLACQAGTCAAASSDGVRKSICPAGGTLTLDGFTLTIPQGALTGCTDVTISKNGGSAPAGYAAYSAVYGVQPEGLTLSKPATVSIDFTGNADQAALFWSRQGTTGFERISGTPSSGRLSAQISHFGQGFVADGSDYVDPPDASCVVGKLVEGRTLGQTSAVALFFTVDDCWGRPLTGLTASDFGIRENDAAISPAESSATILQRNGLQVFASLLIDMSASTSQLLPSVIAAAKDFVTTLQVNRNLPVRIGIQLFAGEAALTEWQAPTLDTPTLLIRLDALGTFAAGDRYSTNLNGAIVAGLDAIGSDESAFRAQNYGGAFTTGYVVVFTDGKDTAGRVAVSAVTSAENGSPDQVLAVGLQSQEYDPTALAVVAPDGVITATDSSQLSTAFMALARRMEGQISRTYLLGYCSPKRSGASNVVSVRVAGATNKEDASYEFDASLFAAGCTTQTFSTVCENRECGGLGCGACDERWETCDAASSLCVPNP